MSRALGFAEIERRLAPAARPAGIETRRLCNGGAAVALDGAVVAVVRPGGDGWRVENVGAGCERAVASREAGIALGQRIARLLAAGNAPMGGANRGNRR